MPLAPPASVVSSCGNGVEEQKGGWTYLTRSTCQGLWVFRQPEAPPVKASTRTERRTSSRSENSRRRNGTLGRSILQHHDCLERVVVAAAACTCSMRLGIFAPARRPGIETEDPHASVTVLRKLDCFGTDALAIPESSIIANVLVVNRAEDISVWCRSVFDLHLLHQIPSIHLIQVP